MNQMQELKIGDELPKSGNMFAQVKQKGDSITFRIAQDPVYSAKHFSQGADGKWTVTDCNRINNPEEQETCETCEKYFEIMKDAKLAKEKGDTAASDELKKQARPYNSSVQFYFPILDRDNKTFRVLRTTLGVKKQLDKEKENGVKVMEVDWVLRNTGSNSPKDYYALTRKDSSDTPKFDAKEKEEFKKAQEFDKFSIADNATKTSLEEEESINALVELAKEEFDVK